MKICFLWKLYCFNHKIHFDVMLYPGPMVTARGVTDGLTNNDQTSWTARLITHDGLVQERRNSIANELHLSYTNPLTYP